MKRLRSLAAQLLFLIILPLFLVLAAVALGSVLIHQRSMRTMVGERDLLAALTAAAGLSGQAVDSVTSAGGLPDTMRQVLGTLQANPHTIVMLVDQGGTAVYHSTPGQVGQRVSHPGVREALAGRSGTLYLSDTPGSQEHVVAYAPVPVVTAGGQESTQSLPLRSIQGLGSVQTWALVVEEPWGEVASPWLRVSLVAPLVLLPAVASALGALWLGLRRVIRPLQRLDTQVTALGWGDFQAVDQPVGGLEEIQELQKAVARMAAQIRAYQESMRGYLDTVMVAQEEERKRLARELHDDTVQDLIALKQRIQAARRRIDQTPEVLDAQFAELQAMVDDTMTEVRRFSRDLRPIFLEEAGLVAALEALARDAGREDLRVSFQVEGEPRRLAPGTELALYRIVQEALNNVARHADASQADLQVTFADHGVAVRIQDNGIGFVLPERVSGLAEAGHYGLMGMQERARLVGAQLTVSSRLGEGTTVEVGLH